MARITVEDCVEKVNNRFALVLLVAKRAKQLLKGARPTESTDPENKHIVNALREVAAEDVIFEVDETGSSEREQIEGSLKR